MFRLKQPCIFLIEKNTAIKLRTKMLEQSQKMAHHCWALLFPLSWGLNLESGFFFVFLVNNWSYINAVGGGTEVIGDNILSILKYLQYTKPQWLNIPQQSKIFLFFFFLVNLRVFQMLTDTRIVRSRVFFSSLRNLFLQATASRKMLLWEANCLNMLLGDLLSLYP